MQKQPEKSLRLILDNIHSIVLQSPFQCRPCRFYSNTEETFLQHWNSSDHLKRSEGRGKFWCGYCCYECENSSEMYVHLISLDHKEVILAINRSVPICISKRLSISCTQCDQSFRYNVELRHHCRLYHSDVENIGTASDAYQNRFQCNLCSENFQSKVSLHRHEKHKHSVHKYFCSICKMEFNSPYEARKHRTLLAHKLLASNPSEKQPAESPDKDSPKFIKKCDKCDFITGSKLKAKLHTLSHVKKESTAPQTANPKTSPEFKKGPRKKKDSNSKKIKRIKCKDCEEIFDNLEALKIHRDSQHPLLTHVCMSCNKSFALPQSLGRHIRTCQPNSIKSLPAASTSEQLPKETEKKSWKCSDCHFSTTYESELLFHQLFHTHGTMNRNIMIKCPLCIKVFRKHSLRCHLRLHTNEKIFECKFCEVKFTRKHNLKDHINNIHKKAAGVAKPSTNQNILTGKTEVFACETCSKTFIAMKNLKRHNLTHEPKTERIFDCTFEGCQYSATSKALLKVHMETHSEGSFKCSHENCNYAGRSLFHLKRHIKVHVEPVNLFKCKECDFKTKRKSHLNRHSFCHSEKKPFKCPHCDYSCKTLDNLRKHVLKTTRHQGKFIFQCNLCGQKDTKKNNIKIFETNNYHEYQLHLENEHASEKESTPTPNTI